MSAEIKKSLSIVVPSPTFTKIDPSQLQGLLNESNVAVVDVRDDDFRGGHVKGSVNCPFGKFDAGVHELAKKLIEQENKDTVIFYCMFSQHRGPTCASTFADVVTSTYPNKEVKIYVLSGGFHQWIKTFSKVEDEKNAAVDDSCIDAFQRDLWQFDLPSQTLIHKDDAQLFDPQDK